MKYEGESKSINGFVKDCMGNRDIRYSEGSNETVYAVFVMILIMTGLLSMALMV